MSFDRTLNDLNALAQYSLGDALSVRDERIHLEKSKGGELKDAERQEIANRIFQDFDFLNTHIEHHQLTDRELKIISEACLPNGIFEKALGNMKKMGLSEQITEKGERLQSQLSMAATYLESDVRLYASFSPKTLLAASRAKRSLALSKKKEDPDHVRLMPRPTAAGTANGTYFLDITEEPHRESTQQQGTVRCGFVAKPSMQEAGCTGNPSGNYGTIRDGIGGGQGVVREWMCYHAQELIGADFGIPETAVISAQQIFLSEEFGLLSNFVEKARLAFNISDAIDLYQIIKAHPEIATPKDLINLTFKELLPYLQPDIGKKLRISSG